MRFVPNAVGITLVAIAAYFAVLWGVEALRVLASPNYGLSDYVHSQVVFDHGRMLGLSSDGLIRLAAFFAASKLAAAIAFAVYLVERARAFAGSRIDHDLLEAALILVVLLTVAMALPALIESNGSVIRLHGLYLALAGVAAMLSAIERGVVAPDQVFPSSASTAPASRNAWLPTGAPQ